MKKILGILLGVLVIVGGGGYILATQADAATPADPLFSVDVFFENVTRALIFDDVSLTEFEMAVLEERESELEAVLGEEDVTEEMVEDCLDEMNMQREKLFEKLGEVQGEMAQQGNTEAVKALEQVQNRYEESLQKQYQTATKAQEQYGVGEAVQKNIDNALKNAGDSTQNQQDNVESEGTGTQGTDNGSGSSGSGSTGGSGNGNN